MDNSNETEDQWMPSDLQVALNLDFMPVTLYNPDITQEVYTKCIECPNIGLTLINKRTGGDNFLICITCEAQIFVLDSHQEEHISFFVKLLKKKELDSKFYVYNGCESNFRLSKGHGISLCNSIDISTMDVFLSLRSSLSSGAIDTYNIESLNSQRFPYRNRIKLAKYYLGVELPQPTDEEKCSLYCSPLTVPAQNYIRKMASTVRAVALRIVDRIDELNSKDSDNIYSFGLLASDEDFEVFEEHDKKSYLHLVTQLSGFKPNEE